MKKFLIYISNQHDLIFKILLIAITISVIAAMLPRGEIQRFDYQKGRTWTGTDLYSPYDFAIFKDPDSLDNERSRAMAVVLPHYVVDTNVRRSISSQLEIRLSRTRTYDTLNSGFVSKLQLGEKILDELYAKGVFESHGNGTVVPAEGPITIVKGKRLLIVNSNALKSVENTKTLAFEQAAVSGDTMLANLLYDLVRANVFYDDDLTTQMRQKASNDVSSTSGLVRKGDLIISKGNVIDDVRSRMLRSLYLKGDQAKEIKQPKGPILLGQLTIIVMSLGMLLVFLGFLRKDIFKDKRKITLLFLLLTLNISMFIASLHFTAISQYAVPLCILPIIIRVFFDTRLALFTHIISVLILGAVAYNGYEFIFMQSIAGMVTIFSVTNLRRRAQLFVSTGFIMLSYFLSYLGIALVNEGTFASVEWMNFVWLLGNVLLTLFAYPLIYLFEKMFDLVSDVSLMEMSDTNTPLLRELSIKAPGTFQHSMQVANLAEAAIYRIGGNSLLVRVGALYHDIGKMETPMYFIENQSTGINPHDDLSFEESASIIVGHVIKGIEKARKNKLPDIVIDFIRTHHGTTMVQYFYQSFLKNFPEKLAKEEKFRYPGPLPFSKETAVLMMADSVEAASRSLEKPDAVTLNNLVDNIIKRQIEQEQFVNSDITFKDITLIKKIFKKMLMSIYHVRVEYPESAPEKN